MGYNPATADAPGFINGFINLQFGNLFGTGRELNANWEQRTRETQEFNLRYKEPWILGLPLSAAAGIEQIIQDTSYVERKVGFGIDYVYNQHLSLSGQLQQRGHTDGGEARLLDGGQVPARALYVEDLLLLAKQIGLVDLYRGVAPAV